eukprot:2538495-Alexandrium_andersonii.AAC.1
MNHSARHLHSMGSARRGASLALNCPGHFWPSLRRRSTPSAARLLLACVPSHLGPMSAEGRTPSAQLVRDRAG